MNTRLHRFYIPPQHNKYGPVPLAHEVWIHDINLLNQWQKVLRYQVGQQLVLFDGVEHERLYEITHINNDGVHCKVITDFKRKLPSFKLYLFWSLLKKDKNDWVIQKCTELGVSHFVPIIAARSEKTGFNIERAKKIIIEAAEQCGRSDIPTIREPLPVHTAIDEYKDKISLYICEQNSLEATNPGKVEGPTGVFIGPEGGWDEDEKSAFQKNNLTHIAIHDFTLRAETACTTVIAKLIQ